MTGKCRGNRTRDLIAVSHLQRQDREIVRGQALGLFAAPGGTDHQVALGQDGLGERMAEPTRDAGHEPDFLNHGISLLVFERRTCPLVKGN